MDEKTETDANFLMIDRQKRTIIWLITFICMLAISTAILAIVLDSEKGDPREIHVIRMTGAMQTTAAPAVNG